EVQSAFLANRQILDGPFILNELISWCKSKKNKAMVFNVDFEKAYNSVQWDCLNDILCKFSFGDRWRMWINGCLNSSMGSMVVNGIPSSEFQFFKGLKQEVLSHLFFVDDAVFIGELNDTNLNTIVHVSKSFFLASSLKINIHKSKLMGIRVGSGEVNRAAKVVGCSTLSTLFSYLGVTVGGRMSKIQTWDEIVRRLSSRLSRWKLKTLLVGGRLTLFKSVLGSIPLYHMFIFKVPKAVINNMEAIRREGLKLDQYDELCSRITSTRLAYMNDRWVWSLTGSGDFTDKLPSRLNFSRLGIDIPSLMCLICESGVESLAHLLFFCLLARAVLAKVRRWWGFSSPELHSYEDWFSWFVDLRLCRKTNNVLEGIFYVMWWKLWSYRNQLLFGATPPRKETIFDDIVSQSYTWCSHRCKFKFNWITWMKDPNLAIL
nr:RNA-directed DNA polymerase, eukaryota [Tanacetum cinerariifolium]